MAIVTAARSLHVREDPGLAGLVIGYLYSGDQVQLTDRCSTDPAGWAEIAWKNGTAWVRAAYLSDNICAKE